MQKLLLLILLCAVTAAHAAGDTGTDMDTAAIAPNPPGPYAVGLQVVEQYDRSRAYKGAVDIVTGRPVTGERARPIKALVWYPAQAGGKRTSAAAYLALNTGDDDFALDAATIKERNNVQLEQIASSMGPHWKREQLDLPMAAVRDARAASGAFPLVVYAPSFSASASENADLCEYLASRGYVVVASASLGEHARTMNSELAGAETQASDIAFLIGYAHTLAQADMRHIAVIGYSWGGLANVIAATRDSRIEALVDLDGSVRYFPELVQAAKYITPASVAVPMLYVAARPRTIEELNRHENSTGFSLLNNMRYSDVYVLTMRPMVHANFSSLLLHFTPDAAFHDYARQEVMSASGWTARYVGQYLDAYLKKSAAAKAFLQKRPEDNGVPLHAAALDFHLSEGPPPTLATFATGLAAHGFDHAQEQYQTLHERDPGFQLSEEQLTSWGYQLLREQHDTVAAIGMLKLATTVYPAAWNTYDSLAEAYELHGDKALAIENYRRSLQLNPHNDNATQHLKSLHLTSPELAR